VNGFDFRFFSCLGIGVARSGHRPDAPDVKTSLAACLCVLLASLGCSRKVGPIQLRALNRLARRDVQNVTGGEGGAKLGPKETFRDVAELHGEGDQCGGITQASRKGTSTRRCWRRSPVEKCRTFFSKEIFRASSARSNKLDPAAIQVRPRKRCLWLAVSAARLDFHASPRRPGAGSPGMLFRPPSDGHAAHRRRPERRSNRQRRPKLWQALPPKRRPPSGAWLAGLIHRPSAKEKNLVGLAARVSLVDGQVVALCGRTGRRKRGTGVPIELGDRWHLGFDHQVPITATMIARLIESGQMQVGRNTIRAKRFS